VHQDAEREPLLHVHLPHAGPAGSQTPDYLLILNVAEGGSLIHVIHYGTGGFIEIAGIAPAGISQETNQLLAMSAFRVGEVSTYTFGPRTARNCPARWISRSRPELFSLVLRGIGVVRLKQEGQIRYPHCHRHFARGSSGVCTL
jgi:hypothetical protein